MNPPRWKCWEIIADNLKKAGWSWGCVSALDCERRTIWIADAHGDDGKQFVVRADEKLTFIELELATRAVRPQIKIETQNAYLFLLFFSFLRLIWLTVVFPFVPFT